LLLTDANRIDLSGNYAINKKTRQKQSPSVLKKAIMESTKENQGVTVPGYIGGTVSTAAKELSLDNICFSFPTVSDVENKIEWNI
jgi:hypothetical protein